MLSQQYVVPTSTLPEDLSHRQARQILADQPLARTFYDAFYEMGDTPRKALLRALERVETLPSSQPDSA